MKKYLKTTVVLAIMFVMADVAFGSVYSYGGSESITLTTANEWAVISAPTKLSAFNYTGADISSILTYNASTGSFVIPSASDLLEPVNAFYMLPNKSTSVSFVWGSYTPGFSSRDLSAGWNLIGTNTDTTAISELSDIKTSVSTLFVPKDRNDLKSLIGDSWGGSANKNIDQTEWTSDVFNPRDGYWINVTSPVTYSKVLN